MTQDIDKKIIMLQENEQFERSIVFSMSRTCTRTNSYNTLLFIKNEIVTLLVSKLVWYQISILFDISYEVSCYKNANNEAFDFLHLSHLKR